MHLSAQTWPRPEPLVDTLERIAPLGYRSIVLTGEPGGYDAAHTAALLKEYGIACWGAASVMAGRRNLVAADAGQRRETVDYLAQLVRMVAEVGGAVVTIVPVTIGKIVADAEPDREWARLVEGLQAVDAEAAVCGVALAIEPINRFETYLVNRAEQAMALVEQVGPGCGVCLDTFHLNIEETDLHDAIRLVGPRLRSVDVADNNRLAPGMGALDWPAIVRTLGEVGYTGALAAEFLPPIDRSPLGLANGPRTAQEVAEQAAAAESTTDFVRIHGSGGVTADHYRALAACTAETLLPLLA